jgi:hypothetical protein
VNYGGVCTILGPVYGSIDNVNTLVGQTSSCDEDDRQTNKQTGQSNYIRINLDLRRKLKEKGTSSWK